VAGAAIAVLVAGAAFLAWKTPGARSAEACASCHAGVTGIGGSHERIGCAACHGGDRRAIDAARAHDGLVRIPGNLADAARTCGQGGCHESILARVEHSIMTTMAGVITVNRRVLGEAIDPSASPPPLRAARVAVAGGRASGC
jgi:hypothetical protein